MSQFDFLRMLEGEIKTARKFNAQTLEGNARANVQNTLQYFEADGRCYVVGEKLVNACAELASAVKASFPTASNDEEIDELTHKALDLAGAFQSECERCGPNSFSRAMGY